MSQTAIVCVLCLAAYACEPSPLATTPAPATVSVATSYAAPSGTTALDVPKPESSGAPETGPMEVCGTTAELNATYLAFSISPV